MKKLFRYIVSFIKEDFSWQIYGFALAFMAATIIFNYSVSFEKKVLDSYIHEPFGMLYYFIFYAVAYYVIAVPKLYFDRSGEVLKDKLFWIKSFGFLALLGVLAGFSIIETWTNTFKDYEYYYISKLMANLRFVVVFIITLFLIWKTADRKMPNMYGFTLKNFDIKPYIIILLLMIPLIALASTQPDFQGTYPKFKPWFPQGDIFGMTRFQMTFIYEITYGLNFIGLELFFRGALVIGMVAVMGRHAVLPMAVTYCFLHFGKPAAECISSFFGGYFLGVIALYTRSIFGGCIVHMGIAFIMEAAAMMQYYAFRK